MTSDTPELDPATAVTVGRIVSAHGLRGEVKVDALSDFPQRFMPGARVWLDGRQIKVHASRWMGKFLIVALEGVGNRTAAQELRGKELQAPEALPITQPDVYYRHDIVGLEVIDENGASLGEVVDVFSTGANDVYTVKGERGELLLPAVDDVIKQVDLANHRLVIDMIEGLEFVGGPKPPKIRRIKPAKAAEASEPSE